MVSIKELGFDDRIEFKNKDNIIMEGVIKDVEYDVLGIELDGKQGWQNWIFIDVDDITKIVKHSNKKFYMKNKK